jgi:hypothetical protein
MGSLRRSPAGISKILSEEMKFLTEEFEISSEEIRFLTEEFKILSEESGFLTEESQDQPPDLCMDILLRLDDLSLCFPPEV